MPKRIALLILGVVLFIGAFFIYQVITGASLLSHHAQAPQNVTTRDSKPLTFESRTSTGELRYVITAQKMDEQSTPGQFLLLKPVATFYTHDGRAITIRGDSCNIAVDQIRHVNSGVSNEPPSVRDGKLSGNIVLTISSKADATDPNKDNDITIRFEKDLTLNGAEQTLTSPGKVQVRSNIIVFDGEGFTLNYSLDKARAENQRVEFFRIEKGNKIILKNKGAKGFSLDNATASTAPARSYTKPAATTEPVNPEDLPTAYQLSFGKEITATHGTTSLTSDQLLVLFTAPTNREVVHAANKSTEDEPIGKQHAQRVSAPTLTTAPATRILPPIDPMGEAGPDDLVITWVGPMEMRPVEHTDMLLVDSKDIALEAVGTPERPVKISEPKRSAVAGKLWYQKSVQRLELVPLPNSSVEFNVVGNTSAEATTVSCQGVSVFLDDTGRNARHVHLAGPGSLHLPPSSLSRKESTNVPLVATWKNDLDVDLDTLTDPKNPKKITQVARRVQMTGTTIKDADFDLAADTLDLMIANIQGSSPALEHLLATGNVIVHSYKKNSSGLQAQRLEVETAMFPTSKTPLPTRVTADGEVSAFQYAEKKADTAGAQPNFRKQIVFGPHLEADLAPKLKTTAATGTSNSDSALSDFGNIGGSGGGNVEVKHFLVSNGVRVTIESSKGDPVNVDADKLEANLPLATLTAKDADHPVHITRGKDDITAPLILLDQTKQTFTIPTPGHFALTPSEKKGKTATPIDIAWSKQMDYSNVTHVARFNGNVAVTTKGKATEPGSLKCDDYLEVQFKPSADKSIPATDIETAGAGGLDHITAKGHVTTDAAQFDDTGKLLMHMSLEKVDALTFIGATQTVTIPGPGVMAIEDFRPEKQKAGDTTSQSARGTTAFSWDGKFAYDTTTGGIRFEKNVEMIHLPSKPFRMSLDKGDATPADGTAKTPSKIILDSELLAATLEKTKEANTAGASGSPIGLGEGGTFKLASVMAGGLGDNGQATIKMDDYRITGYTIGFDADKNLVTIGSNTSVPATAMRTGKGIVEGDEITWDLTKNSEAFTFKNPRGSFEAMSDLQGVSPQN